jgi:DNA-directed RNA polymerase beta subunit
MVRTRSKAAAVATPEDGLDRLPTENEVWYLINTYFKRYGLVRHQLESFNSFISTLLPHIITESREI